MSGLTVAINARSLLGRYNSGIGKYITNLSIELTALAYDYKLSYRILSEKDFSGLPIHKISAHGRVGGVYFDNFTLSHICSNMHIDVLHIPKYVLPRKKTCKVCATVHDMYLFKRPQEFPALVRKYWEKEIPRTIREAEIIITPSEFTKSEILKYTDCPSDKIITIPHGVSDRYFNGNGEFYRKKYGKYVLCVSSIHPRKNIPRLLEAWDDTLADTLVLVGHYGWMEKGLAKKITRSKNIVWLPNVPEEDMPNLYAGAEVFVFPSRYEGFGIPVLEAMAAGVPVVALDIPVMREVTAGQAILVDDSTEAVKEGIRRAISNRKGLDAARKYAASMTWKKSAIAHIMAYKDAANR